MSSNYMFEIKRTNRGYLITGIILFIFTTIVATTSEVKYFLTIVITYIPSILLLIFYFILPRTRIIVKGDTIHILNDSKEHIINLSNIVYVVLVYTPKLTWPGWYLNHLTIRYCINEKLRKLKLGTFSWNESSITELYEYLSMWRFKYGYEVKTIKTLLPFLY